MGSITIADMTELLYLNGVKFDRLTLGTRIALAVLYVLIIIVCAILNGIYLYTFLKTPKLQKPSNVLVSSLLWNNILLLLTVLPLTLLEICTDVVAKNHNVVSVQHYITLSYIWLSFTSAVHIGLHKVYKIRRGLVNSESHKYRGAIIFFVAGVIFSSLMPLIIIVIFFYHGIRPATIFFFGQPILMVLTLLLSYAVIIFIVKKSNNRLKRLRNNGHFWNQQKKTLRKVKKTAGLVVGGFILTLVPFICSSAAELYSFYNENFRSENGVFLYTFRSVGEMILYINSIFNTIVYIYTNREFRVEVRKLDIVKQTTIQLGSLFVG